GRHAGSARGRLALPHQPAGGGYPALHARHRLRGADGVWRLRRRIAAGRRPAIRPVHAERGHGLWRRLRSLSPALIAASCGPPYAAECYNTPARGGPHGTDRAISEGNSVMGHAAPVGPAVFIFDCDNTLLDNDALKEDLDARLRAMLGEE